jgi:PAS domain S-box-containing protein
MIESLANKSQIRSPLRIAQTPQKGTLVLTVSVTVFSLLVLFFSGQKHSAYSQFFYLVALLPVLLAAYNYGLVPGLGTALFFSIALIPQLYWGMYLSSGPSLVFSTIAFIFFLHLFAYIIADLVASNRVQNVLSAAIKDWETLFSRASNQDEVIGFILEQAKTVCPLDEVTFFLRNPLDARWIIYTQTEKETLRPSSLRLTGQQTLAEWLIDQNKPVILNHLDHPSTLVLQSQGGTKLLRSLIALPFIHHDGGVLGWLVLLNREQGRFPRRDLQLLDVLVESGIKALEHAGLFAITDYTLSKQVEHLAAIQRTARELNATLEPRNILEETLVCALEITSGEAGFIGLDAEGLPQTYQYRGSELDAALVYRSMLRSRRLKAYLEKGDTAPFMPPLMPGSKSCLRVPIHYGKDDLGIISVESGLPQAFGSNSEYVLSILVDHAAIALENARLFNKIQSDKQQMSLIIESVADGLLTTDCNGTIITINPAAVKLTGWGVSGSVGQHFCRVLGFNEDDEPHQCILDQVLHEGKVIYEDHLVIRELLGSQRVVALSAAPLMDQDGAPGGAVVQFRDVTQQDEMEQLQREMITSISHELRTPLANIRSVAELIMAEGSTSGLDPGYTDYLNIMLLQSQRLAEFLDRVVDVHRLETGKFTLQIRPLPVSLFVGEVVKQWQIMSPDYKMSLATEVGETWVWADENAFHSVMNNLLDNAVKYSPKGSQIDVRLSNGPHRTVVISVKDQGKGISPEHQPKIFDRFYRVDGGDSQSVYGHGLGLYISKSLVEAMHGMIWVQSDAGQGSRFAFTLPVMETNNE